MVKHYVFSWIGWKRLKVDLVTPSIPTVHLKPLHLVHLLICLCIAVSSIGCTHAEPGPARTIQPNVVAIPTSGSTAYMLLGPQKVALVNSGSNPEAAEIIRALQEHNRSLEDVRAIFTTSPHREINAGAPIFQKAITYTGLEDHRTMMSDKHPKALLPKLKARLSPRPASLKSINNVYPGDHLQTQGFSIDVVGMPGVSRDSMMYIYEGILFSGESLLIQDGQLSLAPRYQVASQAQNIKSLSRLNYLQFNTIADAYGQVADMGPKDVSAFLESLR